MQHAAILDSRPDASFPVRRDQFDNVGSELCFERITVISTIPDKSLGQSHGDQKLGVFSSARRPDSQPMWAYYCDDSKGICFELEWSDELLATYQLMPTEIQYADEPRVHHRVESNVRFTGKQQSPRSPPRPHVPAVRQTPAVVLLDFAYAGPRHPTRTRTVIHPTISLSRNLLG